MAVNSNRDSEGIIFKVISHIGVLAEYQTGWTKEVNLISWNEGTPKYDIRDWNPEHDHMSKGITLHEEEARKLTEILSVRFGKTDAPEVPAEEKQTESEAQVVLQSECPAADQPLEEIVNDEKVSV